MNWSLGGQDSPHASGQEKSRSQHLESLTGVWVGKTPPNLVGRRKVVCNIWSHALVFGWVKLPLASGKEQSCLQHLESCISVWVGKTPPPCMWDRETSFATSRVMHWSLSG